MEEWNALGPAHTAWESSQACDMLLLLALLLLRLTSAFIMLTSWQVLTVSPAAKAASTSARLGGIATAHSTGIVKGTTRSGL